MDNITGLEVIVLLLYEDNPEDDFGYLYFNYDRPCSAVFEILHVGDNSSSAFVLIVRVFFLWPTGNFEPPLSQGQIRRKDLNKSPTGRCFGQSQKGAHPAFPK